MSAERPLFLPVTVTLPSVTFFQVHRYTLTDALNTVPEMTVDVFGTDPDLDMAALLGQPSSVELGEPAVPRFDGIVRHVEQRPLDIGGASVFALTVVPRPWLLRERCGHRIFQERDALGIETGPSGFRRRRAAPKWSGDATLFKMSRSDSDFLSGGAFIEYRSPG